VSSFDGYAPSSHGCKFGEGREQRQKKKHGTQDDHNGQREEKHEDYPRGINIHTVFIVHGRFILNRYINSIRHPNLRRAFAPSRDSNRFVFSDWTESFSNGEKNRALPAGAGTLISLVDGHGLVDRSAFANDGVARSRHANGFFGRLLVNVSAGGRTSAS
jgi:hypothetical protein